MELDEATQKVADQLDRSVIVFDTELHVLEFSWHDEEPDRARTPIILQRRASARAARMIAEARAKEARGAVAVPPIEGVEAQVVVPLRHRGHLYGYLCFPEREAVDDDRLRSYTDDLRPAADNLAAILAVRRMSAEDEARSQQRLLAALLDADAGARERAAAAVLESDGLARARHYTVALVRLRDHTAQPGAATYSELDIDRVLRAIVRTSTAQAFGALHGLDGVVILPGDPDVPRLDRIVRKEQDGTLVVGLGGARAELADIVESYQEARIAGDAVGRVPEYEGRVGAWGRLGLDRMLLQIPLDSVRLDDLPDGLALILESKSEIDLPRTLEAYLDCGGNAPEAAQRLHIHRSTLYYRLDKIEDATGWDLADGATRRDLHTGLRIARLAGLWNG